MTDLRVAILGAGYIGTDLLYKIGRSARLSCTLVVGRREGSAGLRRAASLGHDVSTGGIEALVEAASAYDIVFDCTDAISNRAHWDRLRPLGKRLINLTPARSGEMIVPAVNIEAAVQAADVNMVSCGGQAAMPLLSAAAQRCGSIAAAEIVTTASSGSVGQGTRINLDEYLEVTEAAARHFSGAREAKALVNLSPAKPPPVFRVALFVEFDRPWDLDAVRPALEGMAATVRTYCPGYAVSGLRRRVDGALAVNAEVTGGGDYLPIFAGNLDIINHAAISAAEAMA